MSQEKIKREEKMNHDEIQILTQLIGAMDDSFKKMEDAFNKRDIQNFNEAKEAVLNFQRQIAQMLVSISKQNTK
jgi:Na+/phosphate symporter